MVFTLLNQLCERDILFFWYAQWDDIQKNLKPTSVKRVEFKFDAKKIVFLSVL